MLSPPQNQDAGDLKSAIFSHLFGGCFDGCSSSVSVHLLAIEWDCHEGCISSLEKVYTAKCSALRRFAKSQKADSKSVECNFVGFNSPPGTISNTNVVFGFRVLPRSLVRCSRAVSGWPVHLGMKSGTVRIYCRFNILALLAADFISADSFYLR
jgi:hypothetical protein